MKHFDLGLNSEKLLWREHIFSDYLRRLGAENELVWEPVFNNAGETIFTLVPQSEIKWDWSDWEYAELFVMQGDRQIDSRTLRHPESASVKFTDFRNATALEIILYNFDGQSTNAVKHHLPEVFSSTAVTFEIRGGSVLVSADRELPTRNLVIEKYRHSNGAYQLVDSSKFSNNPQILIPIKNEYFGKYLVVVKQTGQRRKMVCYAPIGFENKLYSLIARHDEEQEALQKFIEGASLVTQPVASKNLSWNEWLGNWSRAAQQKLSKLAGAAIGQLNLDEGEAQHYVQNYPTGLHRALVLDKLGYPSIRSRKWKIEWLNGADFLEDIGKLKKGLGRMVESFPTIEEKVWAISNVENVCFEQAYKNARGKGLRVLQRELHLLESRSAAVQARKAQMAAS